MTLFWNNLDQVPLIVKRLESQIILKFWEQVSQRSKDI
jgi:hypothetical protein